MQAQGGSHLLDQHLSAQLYPAGVGSGDDASLPGTRLTGSEQLMSSYLKEQQTAKEGP